MSELNKLPAIFDDPAMDRFASSLIQLASELWVQREELMNVVQALQAKGLVSAEDIAEQAQNAQAGDRHTAARAFIDTLFEPLRER